MVIELAIAHVRFRWRRLLLLLLGLVVGFLAVLSSAYYFAFVVSVPEADMHRLPADLIVNPVNTAFLAHPSVVAAERIIVLESRTAAGTGTALALPTDSTFLGKYPLLAGHWPLSAEEIAVPHHWLQRTGLQLGDQTPLTIRFSRFHGTTWYTVSGVFEDPFTAFNGPIINNDGYERAKKAGGFGRVYYFIDLHETVDAVAWAQNLIPEGSASVKSVSLLAAEAQSRALTHTYGDIAMLSGILNVFLLIIVGLGMMNILLLATMQRQHEIGVLKTYGLGEAGIWALFFLESLLLCSIALGITLGVFYLGLTIGYKLGLLPLIAAPSGAIHHLLIAVWFIAFVPTFYPLNASLSKSVVELLRTAE